MKVMLVFWLFWSANDGVPEERLEFEMSSMQDCMAVMAMQMPVLDNTHIEYVSFCFEEKEK